MSERDGKVLYTIAPEDNGWRLSVELPQKDPECSYQYVGSLCEVLRYVTLSAGGFQKEHPPANEMLGGYFVRDRREWKPNVLLQVDGREEVERLKESLAAKEEELRLAWLSIAEDEKEIARLKHTEQENIRKIGNLRADRKRLEDEVDEQAALAERTIKLNDEILANCDRLEEENKQFRDRDTDEELLNVRAKVELLEEDLAMLRGNNTSLVRLSERLNDENERLKTDNARLVVNDARVRQMNLLYAGFRSEDAKTIKSLNGDLEAARKNLEILRAHIMAAGIADQEVLNATASPLS